MAGTNSETGTTHEGIEKLVRATNSKAFRNIFKEKDAFSYLNNLLSGHSFFLLRGLTNTMMKHWYVVYSKNDDQTYNLLDPSYGTISMSKIELEEIWKPRDYDGFAFYR